MLDISANIAEHGGITSNQHSAIDYCIKKIITTQYDVTPVYVILCSTCLSIPV